MNASTPNSLVIERSQRPIGKLTKAALWILLNGACVALAVIGTLQHVGWAWRGFLFLFWMNFVMSILGSLSDEMKEHMRKRGRSVPLAVALPFDILFATFLASQGHWILAAFQIIQTSAESYVFGDHKTT